MVLRPSLLLLCLCFDLLWEGFSFLDQLFDGAFVAMNIVAR